MTAPEPIAVSIPATKAQVEAVRKAGRGATVKHPRARSAAGRRQLASELQRAGLDAAIASTLGFTCATPRADPKPELLREPDHAGLAVDAAGDEFLAAADLDS